MSARNRTVHACVLALFCLAALLPIIRTIAARVQQPQLWDFACFWLYGNATAHGANAYDPAVLTSAAQALGVHGTPSFAAEVLNLGAVYPPPSLLIFVPIGLLSNIHAASALWMAAQAVALIGLAWVLWRGVFTPYGAAGGIAALLLSCAFPPTLATLSLAQTLLPATLLCALFVFDRNSGRRGLWIGLGAAFKPLVIVPIVYPLIRRHVRTVAVAAATIVAMTVSTEALASGTIGSFLHNNPATREPAYLFHEPQYQSLFAVLLRLSHNGMLHGVAVSAWTLTTAVMLIAITLVMCGMSPGEDADLAAGAFIALSLLVYPATADFYAELLLVPLAVLWMWCLRHGVHLLWPALLFVVDTALLSYGPTGSFAFLAFLLTWITAIGTISAGRFAVPNARWLQAGEEGVLDGH